MKQHTLLTLFAAPLLLTVLSGCTVRVGEEPCTPSQIEGPKTFAAADSGSSVAHQSGVEDPYELRIHVTSETRVGPELEGVRVVVIGREERTVEVACGDQERTTRTYVDYVPVAIASTGADGYVSAFLDPSETVHVAVEAAPGHSGESRTNVAPGGDGGQQGIDIPLLRTSLTLRVEGQFTTPETLASVAPFQAMAVNHALAFQDDSTAHAKYLERVATILATMRWTNTPTAFGDLYPGLAVGAQAPFVTSNDELQTPLSVAAEESVTADRDLLDEHRSAFTTGEGLSVVALTDQPIFAVDHLAYTLDVEAEFPYEPEFQVA